MAITYSINASSEIHGVMSNWQRVPLRQTDDGAIVWHNHALNTWDIPVMTIATFETLKTAEGDTLTSLETNDIDDRSAAASFATAILENVVNGDHTGLNMLNVKLVFRADLTSIISLITNVIPIPPGIAIKLVDQTFRPVWWNYYKRRRVITSQ